MDSNDEVPTRKLANKYAGKLVSLGHFLFAGNLASDVLQAIRCLLQGQHQATISAIQRRQLLQHHQVVTPSCSMAALHLIQVVLYLFLLLVCP
jgi:hypothetical protein